MISPCLGLILLKDFFSFDTQVLHSTYIQSIEILSFYLHSSKILSDF